MTRAVSMQDVLSNPIVTVSVGVSVVFWLAAYAFAIRRAFLDKAPVFPMVNICLNISWEMIFSFIYPDPNSHLRTFMYLAWFALDAIILFQAFRYGRQAQTVPFLKENYYATLVATLAFAFVGLFTFVQYYKDSSGNESAFFINLWMSIAFISVYWTRRDFKGLSLVTAWGKMIGTAIATVNTHFFYSAVKPDKPNWGFLEFLGITIFILDVFYIVALQKRKKKLGLSWKETL